MFNGFTAHTTPFNGTTSVQYTPLSVFNGIKLGSLVPFFQVCDKMWQVHCFNDMTTTTCSIKEKSKLSDLQHFVTAIFLTIQII